MLHFTVNGVARRGGSYVKIFWHFEVFFLFSVKPLQKQFAKHKYSFFHLWSKIVFRLHKENIFPRCVSGCCCYKNNGGLCEKSKNERKNRKIVDSNSWKNNSEEDTEKVRFESLKIVKTYARINGSRKRITIHSFSVTEK